MKGTFRIGGAAACGIALILGAFFLRGGTRDGREDFVVAVAPERSAIHVTDENANGIEDWEERFTVFEPISVPTSTTWIAENTPYEPPSTLTGRFAQAFFQDYLEGKIGGVDFSDPTAFAGQAVKAVESSTRVQRHTRYEITEIESTPESIRNYGNEIAGVMLTYSIKNENEILIFARALEAEDPKLLEPLAPIRMAYENMIMHGLLVPVPADLVDEHLALMNAFEAIATDIRAMESAFSDPLYALARSTEYKEKDVDSLYAALLGISNALREYDIRYEKDELGATFLLFEEQ